jgi:hypothetical protein
MEISWGWKPRYHAVSKALSRTGSNGKARNVYLSSLFMGKIWPVKISGAVPVPLAACPARPFEARAAQWKKFIFPNLPCRVCRSRHTPFCMAYGDDDLPEFPPKPSYGIGVMAKAFRLSDALTGVCCFGPWQSALSAAPLPGRWPSDTTVNSTITERLSFLLEDVKPSR